MVRQCTTGYLRYMMLFHRQCNKRSGLQIIHLVLATKQESQLQFLFWRTNALLMSQRTSKIEHQESKQSMPYIQKQQMLRQLTVFPAVSCGLAAMLFPRHTFQVAVMDRELSKTEPLIQYDQSFTPRNLQWELHWHETVSSTIFNTSQWQKEKGRRIYSPCNSIS